MTQGICPHCKAKMKTYRHGLNKGLAIGLSELHRIGGRGMLRDMFLTKSQFNNFQKLRYWSLVNRINDTHEWQINDNGLKFLNGEMSIQKTVMTYRGIPTGYDGPHIFIDSVLKIEDMWWRVDYAKNSF